MRGWFSAMVVNSQRGKSAVFGETLYVVRIVEHRIEFPLFYINCDRNGPIDIIRNQGHLKQGRALPMSSLC